MGARLSPSTGAQVDDKQLLEEFKRMDIHQAYNTILGYIITNGMIWDLCSWIVDMYKVWFGEPYPEDDKKHEAGSDGKTLEGLIAVLTTLCFAIILSFIIQPKLGDVLPAYNHYGVSEELLAHRVDVDTYIAQVENEIEKNPEEIYRNLAYLYMLTDNDDLAIDALNKCFAINPSWIYVYDIGTLYCAEIDYPNALKYFKHALQYNPPLEDRGMILDLISRMEDYYFAWFQNLIK